MGLISFPYPTAALHLLGFAIARAGRWGLLRLEVLVQHLKCPVPLETERRLDGLVRGRGKCIREDRLEMKAESLK